jgi:tetratricopeptide (TPR) repeat protein
VKALAGLLLATLLAGCVSQGESKVDYSMDEQLRKADLAYREARLEDAEPLYRQITLDHPELKDVWFRLGNIYTRQNQLDAAVRAYERTIQLDKNEDRAWYNLSLVRLKQAVATLEAASQTLPADSKLRPHIIALHDSLLERSGVPKQEEPSP